MLEALVFSVYDLGFVPRCALEEDDSSELRLSKIERIIEECQYGIHDLSAVALDQTTNLPRFNMPLELGLFLGCRRFGSDVHRKKRCVILDTDRFRYRSFISDISGQDIHAHGGDPRQAIIEVRNWLAAAIPRSKLPGGSEIAGRFERFRRDLPALCAALRRDPEDLIFVDLSEMIPIWLKSNR
ncbi:MAG: hypothetical protein IT168_24985 [Bryobacterales bacterium]|nr:hypothetical protein [Bryobacterales bacterium]